MGILWAHTGAIGCIVLTVGSPHPWVVESHGSVTETSQLIYTLVH